MKVVKTSKGNRRLVAVLGSSRSDERVIFLRARDGGVMFISGDSVSLSRAFATTLEELVQDTSRVPVYEGDTITITF